MKAWVTRNKGYLYSEKVVYVWRIMPNKGGSEENITWYPQNNLKDTMDRYDLKDFQAENNWLPLPGTCEEVELVIVRKQPREIRTNQPPINIDPMRRKDE